MDLRAYQHAVLRGMHIKDDAGRIPHAALGLTGEAGEVADIIKKSQYTNGTLDIPHLIEELGDTLWYLTFLAGVLGYPLDELASLNIEKLKKRRPDIYGKVDTEHVCGARGFNEMFGDVCGACARSNARPENPCAEGTCSCPAGYCA